MRRRSLGFRIIRISPQSKAVQRRLSDAYLNDWQSFTAAHLQKFFGGQFGTGPGGSAEILRLRDYGLLYVLGLVFLEEPKQVT